jgi:hypothetical protein
MSFFFLFFNKKMSSRPSSPRRSNVGSSQVMPRYPSTDLSHRTLTAAAGSRFVQTSPPRSAVNTSYLSQVREANIRIREANARRKRCPATTLDGIQCDNLTLREKDFCHVHQSIVDDVVVSKRELADAIEKYINTIMSADGANLATSTDIDIGDRLAIISREL